MGKNISYNARTFEDYKEELKTFTKKYYPEIINDFNDSSIGQWFIDLNSAVADDLGYYMDRMFQETQLDQAQNKKSILNIARTNGLKITGRKPSMVEAKWSCFLPVNSTQGESGPDYSYAPILYKGTQASGGGQKFELVEDLYFSEQFNSNGVSNRTIIPKMSQGGGKLEGYTVSKTCVMLSVEGKIYKQLVNPSDLSPFFEITLPESNVVSIHSVVILEGFDNQTPTINEFMDDSSSDRWYEVNNFTDDKIFKKDIVKSYDFVTNLLTDLNSLQNITGATNYGNTYVASMDDNSKIYGFIPIAGKWESVNRKFITEYTDNGYCKIIFGSGLNDYDLTESLYNATDFTKFQITRMVNNKFLGELPKSNSTIYVYYSVGGGKESNIGAEAMTSIPYMNIAISGSNSDITSKVRNSILVVNTIPSISGRDELTTEEIRFLIKYNNASQDRCVTLKDYYNKIITMPSQFGSPYKIGVSEKNNKILITLLGLAHDGTLSKNISQIMIDNIIEYLSEYKMINDYIQIQAGKILNLRFQVYVTVEQSQNISDVMKKIALFIGDYMDVNKHKLGDEIYISKMKSAIGSIPGVKNLKDLKIFNLYGGLYSTNTTKQSIIKTTQTNNSAEIDLIASDGVLFSDDDTMFEIKNPKTNISIEASY